MTPLIDPENGLRPMLLAELVVYDLNAGATKTLYFSDQRDYRTKATDTPARTLYRGLIQHAGTIAFDVLQAWTNGVVDLDIGQITLVNTHNALDGFKDYVFDGFAATLYLGTLSATGALTKTILQRSLMEQPDIGQTVTIVFRPQQYGLDREILTATFAGTGGIEGGSDVAGRTKPRAYGTTHNAELIPVDTGNLIYFVSDRSANPVSVLDIGIELTFDGSVYLADTAALYAHSVAPGYFAYTSNSAANGPTLVKVGSIPAGQLTTSPLGDTNTPPAVGGIFQYLVGEALGAFQPVEMAAQYGSGADTASGQYGLYISDTTTKYTDAIRDLLGSIAGWSWYNSVTSTWIIDNLANDPSVSQAQCTLVDDDIISMTKLGVPNVPGAGVPPWNINYQYQKVELVQTSGLAAATPLSVRNFFGQQYRKVQCTDATIKTKYPLAQSITVTGNCSPWHLSAPQEPQNFVNALFTALTLRRDFYRIVFRLKPALLKIYNNTWLPALMPSYLDKTAGYAYTLGVRSKRFGFATTGKGTHCWIMAGTLDLAQRTYDTVVWTTYRNG